MLITPINRYFSTFSDTQDDKKVFSDSKSHQADGNIYFGFYKRSHIKLRYSDIIRYVKPIYNSGSWFLGIDEDKNTVLCRIISKLI